MIKKFRSGCKEFRWLGKVVIIFTQPFRSGKIWHKVNFFKRSLRGLNCNTWRFFLTKSQSRHNFLERFIATLGIESASKKTLAGKVHDCLKRTFLIVNSFLHFNLMDAWSLPAQRRVLIILSRPSSRQHPVNVKFFLTEMYVLGVFLFVCLIYSSC